MGSTGDLTSSRVLVLYIGGEGRSGSTILSEMLANLPGFVPVGEILGIWQALRTDELCGCGRAFSRCDFWSAVGERAFGGWDHADVERLLELDERFSRVPQLPRLLVSTYRRSEHDRLTEYQRALRRLYRGARDESGASVLVDSTKNPAYAFVLRGVDDFDLRFVHLVRDSRGVASSWSKDSITIPDYAGHPELAGTVVASQAPWKTALRWDAVNLVFPPLTPSRHRQRINYEALVSDPVGQLARILQLVGIGPADARRRAEASAPFSSSRTHTIGGNPVRFQQGPIELRADEEWRVRLTPAQKAVVSALTLPLLLRYGYAVGRTA